MQIRKARGTHGDVRGAEAQGACGEEVGDSIEECSDHADQRRLCISAVSFGKSACLVLDEWIDPPILKSLSNKKIKQIHNAIYFPLSPQL